MTKELDFQKSNELLKRALNVIPHGTNSLARLTVTTGIFHGFPMNYPKYMESAKGSHIYDADGNEFIDYHCAFGPVILGHAHPKVAEAVKKQVDKAVIFGLNHEMEVKLCEKIVKHVPCAERVQLLNTGSGATNAALRYARSYTGRQKFVRFDHHYHGYYDWQFYHQIPAGGLTRFGISKGVVDDGVCLPWNNLDVMEKVLTERGNEIAAVFCEPIMGNGGAIMPEKGYLESLRKITKEQGIMLVFDEVVTGFRLGLGGAQEMLGVIPDLATFAKALGNGFPIAAVAGKKEVLETTTYIGGTYNSNPISTVASLATVTELENQENYKRIYNISESIMNGIRDAAEDVDIEVIVQGPGPFFSVIFTEHPYPITKPEQLPRVGSLFGEGSAIPHAKRVAVFYQKMLNRGIFQIPGLVNRWHLTAAHTEEDANRTIEAAEEALKEAKESNRNT